MCVCFLNRCFQLATSCSLSRVCVCVLFSSLSPPVNSRAGGLFPVLAPPPDSHWILRWIQETLTSRLLGSLRVFVSMSRVAAEAGCRRSRSLRPDFPSGLVTGQWSQSAESFGVSVERCRRRTDRLIHHADGSAPGIRPGRLTLTHTKNVKPR